MAEPSVPDVSIEAPWGPITRGMVEHLRDTRPWVLFVSILGFVGAGFMVVLALAVAVIGALPTESDELGLAGGIALAAVYLLGALLYVVFAFRLYQYAAAIRSFTSSRDARSMEAALGHQRAFWRLVGIVGIVYLVILALIVLAAVVAGLLAALG
jgi:hypothetical protein